MHKRHFLWAALAVAVLIPMGCEDGPEEGRAVIAATVNSGNPIESDVIDSTGAVFEDFIPIALASRPYNDFITAPRGDVIIESYRIVWERTDGGTGTLATREETVNVYLPVGGNGTMTIRLVSWSDKTGPVLQPIVGTNQLVTMRATIEFTAREVGTDHEVKTAASVTVNFADTL
jgi:hypothetical protein